MRIQHNIAAMSAYRNYNNNNKALSGNLEKLSSGYKINRAGDDAAGLAISEKMRAQITGLDAAQKNVKDGTSLVKTAEGAMQEIHDMLNRMDYLATQSANGTYDNEVDRANLQKEVESLKSEINRIADSANFNGIKLLDGSLGGQSISAVGSILEDSMVDGTSPTPAGTAKVTVTLGAGVSNNPTSIAVDSAASKTYDRVQAGVAGKAKAEITLATGAKIFGVAATGVTVGSLTSAIASTALGKGFTVTVATRGGTAIGSSDTITKDHVVILEAKTAGDTGITEASIASGAAAVEWDPGYDEGGGNGNKTRYELTINMADLEGGQKITLGSKTVNIINTASSASTSSTAINIFGIDVSKASNAATNGAKVLSDRIKTALTSQFGSVAGQNFSVKVSWASGAQTAKVTITATAAGTAANVGMIGVQTANGKNPVTGTIEYKKSASPATTTHKQAKVTYSGSAIKASQVTAGMTITLGDVTIKVVASSTASSALKSDEIRAGATFKDNLAQVIENQASFKGGKVEYNGTNGTLSIEGKDLSQTLDSLKTTYALSVTEAPASTSGQITASNGFTINVGSTTVAQLKEGKFGAAVGLGSNVKLSDVFNITVTDASGKALADSATITAGAKITFEAKNAGKLTDNVMKAITYEARATSASGLSATSEVRPGWDEGTDGAGNNTHYGLKIDTTALAGGNSFSFGTGNKARTFDISFDDENTSNGTTPDTNEVSGGRVTINLSSTMTVQEKADAIKKAISDNMGSGDWNVKAEVSGYNITLSVDAKKATEDTNLGGVRYSSESKAFSGADYKAYNSFDGGTPGTYAQVSYEFDPSNLKAGDSLTIGNTTIKVGEKTVTEKGGDGSVKSITLSEADAQDSSKLIKAFESAGYKSGQLNFADGKLTITGTEAGQKAADLANGAGKVNISSTRSLIKGGLRLQIGDTSDSFNQLEVRVGDMHVTALGIGDIDIGFQEGAQAAIDKIKNAINQVSSVRGDLGAIQNRLDHTANNLSVMSENIQDAESTIRDTDVAEEMMSYVKNNILVQSAQAMLAQANQLPQGVLQLLG